MESCKIEKKANSILLSETTVDRTLKEDKIVSRIKDYENIFPWDFYLELIYHDDIPKQKLVTDYLII